jgi:hypothetical protein
MPCASTDRLRIYKQALSTHHARSLPLQKSSDPNKQPNLTMTSNYSLYSIPAYWFLTLVPHAYAVLLLPFLSPLSTDTPPRSQQ